MPRHRSLQVSETLAARSLIAWLVVGVVLGVVSAGVVLVPDRWRDSVDAAATRVIEGPGRSPVEAVPARVGADAGASDRGALTSTVDQVRRVLAASTTGRTADRGPVALDKMLGRAGLEPWVVRDRFVIVPAVSAVDRTAASTGGPRSTQVVVASRVSATEPWTVAPWRAALVSADPPEVSGDDDAGAIVADGSVLLPGDFVGDADARESGSNCPGCRWRLDLACPVQGDLCGGALVGCRAGELRYVVRLLRPPVTEWAVIGTLCRGPGEEILAVDELAERVRDRFVELLPRAEPAVQPSTGVLVQVPAVFRSQEPAAVGPVVERVSGYSVSITADAAWTWRFGDGNTLTTTSPGGRYPDLSVSHVYARPGRYDAQVTTAWRGEFLVDGNGPYPVAGGPVLLDATVPVVVSQARAVLIAS